MGKGCMKEILWRKLKYLKCKRGRHLYSGKSLDIKKAEVSSFT
jgi:hypothetical protein